jgi:glycosyltransferase involved in cell wall biosynthesis
MRVVHLTSVHSPFDTRILYKECTTLAQEFEVTLVAPHERGEVVNGVTIRPVPRQKSRRRRMLRTPWDVYRAAIAENGDVYHFHDPELIPIGLLLKVRGKRVIYDAHEHLPRQIANKEWLQPRFLRKLVALAVGVLERFGALVFDAIVTAAPSISARFPSTKTVLVRNFAYLALVDAAGTVQRDTAKTVVVYPGSLTRARGIRQLIEAVDLLQGEAVLWLMGPWHSEAFRRECESLPGWRFTAYLGYEKVTSVLSRLKVADIGLHLPLPDPNYSDGLPVKGFEFMACSLPFITTDEPSKRATFEGCALFADPRDPRDIAEKIDLLMGRKELRHELGSNGRIQVEQSYSWERESKKLQDLYHTFKTSEGVA